MNTKYPLNGRYTSLGDIVQEYGKYSQWPSEISKEIPDQDPDQENEEEQQQSDMFLKKTFFWDGTSQPFIEFVYGTEGQTEKAIYPYELVWFEDSYSRTKKDLNSNMYKLVQVQDVSDFSFGREIRAKYIANYEDNKKYGIPFRFIIPLKEPGSTDRFYYNYKTSSGEAVVMYALRNIIDTLLQKFDKEKAKQFLFGSNENNGLEILNEDNQNITVLDNTNTEVNLQLYVLNTLDENKYFNKNDDSSTKLIEETENIEYFIYPSLFTYNVYKKSNNNKLDLDNFLNTKPFIYSADDSADTHSIFADIDETLELSPYAYYLLGEFVWSKKHIQYFNYTTDKRPKLKNNPFDYYGRADFNNTITLNLKLKTKIINEGNVSEESEIVPLNINDELLERTILYLVHDYSNTTIFDYNNFKYKELRNKNDFPYYTPKYIDAQNVAYKLLYFCKLFLDSQRFYYSYVTAMRFIRISTLSYAQEQPVLRCDLGIFQIVQSIVIKSAVHDYMTALPAGPLSLDTTIKINIAASVKYEGMQNPIDENFPLLISFKTIKDWTDLEQGETESKPNWIRLITPGNGTSPTLSDIIGFKYGVSDFLTVKYEDPIDNNIYGDSDCSLGTVRWPLNNNLRVTNESQLENKKNFIDKSVVADTYDLTTYNNILGNYTEINGKNISPFGCLRIHTVYSTDTEESIQNSSYYIDVSIYRCKNYYYETSKSETIENSELYFYYDSIRTNNGVIFPNTKIFVLKSLQDNDTYENVANLDNYFNRLSSKEYTYYSIHNNSNYMFLTIKEQNGTFYIYASGAKALTTNTSDEFTYKSPQNLIIEGYRGNVWDPLIYDTDYETLSTNNNYLAIKFFLNDSNSIKYIRIKQAEPNSPIYYFKNSIKRNTNCQFYIHPLLTKDNTTTEQSITGATNIIEDKLNISFILYNKDLNENNLTYDNLTFAPDAANKRFDLNRNSIHFKLTSVYYDEKLTPRYYDQTGTVYIYYNTGMDRDNYPIYNDIPIYSTESVINLYVAFNPIYKINYNSGTLNGTAIIFTNTIYYNDGTEKQLNNANLFVLKTKEIYLKEESLSIDNKNISNYININYSSLPKFILKLKYDGKQFTYITNDMKNGIDLKNLIITSKNNISFENISFDTAISGSCLVRIFIDSLSIGGFITVKDSSNTDVVLQYDSIGGYNYFIASPSSSYTFISSINFLGFSYYGIYDSLSGGTTSGNTKTITITEDTTIICKVKMNV